MLYFILKQVFWRLQIYNLFRDFKNALMNLAKSIIAHIFAIFEYFAKQTIYTYLQNKRMRRCGVAPPPIIFERLKLPQQIIYRRKENLSESPNHQKYWENILVSRFYEQFSRNRRNLGHFGSSKKFQTLRISTYHISFWSTWSGDSKYIICFAKYLNFAKIKQ